MDVPHVPPLDVSNRIFPMDFFHISWFSLAHPPAQHPTRGHGAAAAVDPHRGVSTGGLSPRHSGGEAVSPDEVLS